MHQAPQASQCRVVIGAQGRGAVACCPWAACSQVAGRSREEEASPGEDPRTLGEVLACPWAAAGPRGAGVLRTDDGPGGGRRGGAGREGAGAGDPRGGVGRLHTGKAGGFTQSRLNEPTCSIISCRSARADWPDCDLLARL